ncbi:MAG TPA: PfkB family carbohydrate kinase [Verrucomicrobiae bacterium]
MNGERFQSITEKYVQLRIAIVGDFCLDRYLEIDPARQEISIETGLPVHNVVNVRSQPGAAGTILNNLIALGIGQVYPVGFCGTDGEGFELKRALRAKGSCVHMQCFFATDERRTFTYCKPLVLPPGKTPVELNRLDSKNWTPTPALLQGRLIDAVNRISAGVDAIILMDQVDVPETGVVTRRVLDAIGDLAKQRAQLLVLADSRRGLRGYPPVCFKMNAAELSALTGARVALALDQLKLVAPGLAGQHGRPVFVTLSERGILGALPTGEVEHVPCHPVRGEIDVVGAGDAVMANLAAALAAGATLRECLELANAAASIVIHQLGTTGTATVADLRQLLAPSA